MIAKMTNREKLIYLAGIVDGEGHFCLTKCKNGQGRSFIRPGIMIVQKNREGLLEWIQENYGGKVYTQKPIMRLGAMRQWSTWSLYGRIAVELAKLLEPYLIVKKEQVKRLTNVRYDKRGWMVKDSYKT
jgi:hypothetical protein